MIPELHNQQGQKNGWKSLFCATACATESELSRMQSLLNVSSGDIYSGRLPYTMEYLSGIASGKIAVIGAARDITINDVLSFLAFVMTLSRIARTGTAPLHAPSHLVQTSTGCHPAFALSSIRDALGMASPVIRQIVTLLVHDGAFRLVRAECGAPAIIVQDGYVEDRNIRRFLQVR